MKEIADKILETIKDYRNDDGIILDSDYIISWGNSLVKMLNLSLVKLVK